MEGYKVLNLENDWYIAKDSENIGKAVGFEKSIQKSAIKAFVPSIIQQFFPEYHGVAYYWCKFVSTLKIAETERVILNFGGADYKAEVWLNGKFIGEKEGGETPFSFDVTGVLLSGKENLLAVRIVNPTDVPIDGLTLMNIPHRNKEVEKRAGCNLNHGGLWYGVSLNVVPAVYISDKFLQGDIYGNLLIDASLISTVNTDGEIFVKVYENNAISGISAQNTVKHNFINGENNVKLKVLVQNVKLWDIDNPHLYRVEITVKTKFGEHTQFVKFGFREFKIINGFFYLNGKKIFLKSAHSGNVFPAGQMLPVHAEQMRQDFIYAKASGFNAIRSIAGLFRPEQLDLADEIGLLIYEECYASWCMGYSAVDNWSNDKEYQEMLTRHTKISVGSESEMLKRWEIATVDMVKRDRNHPSVVIWGLLNETYVSGIYKTAVKFLPKLRELDPSRLVILSSGRWDVDYSVGSASNPYSSEWQNVWGNDGDENTIGSKNVHLVGDRHYYPTAPINESSANHIRQMGSDTKYPVFFSEFGVGALFNVIEEYRYFIQNGESLDLEDSGWLGYQANAFTKDFYRLGLNKIYPFPESFLKDSQRYNAEERKREFDLIRSNNNLCGYSLTGLLDHGMCGEGLWSYWRRWKPEMFDAVSEGWAKLRFCNFVTENSYSGDGFTVESVLANDGVLKSGNYTVNFAITSDKKVEYAFSTDFYLNGEDFATPIIKRKIDLKLQQGKYYFTAELMGGSPAATTTSFYVYDKPTVNNSGKIYVYGLNDGQKNKMRELNIDFTDYKDETVGSVFIGKTDVNVKAFIDKAKRGLDVIFLSAEVFDGNDISALKEVVSDIELTNHRDWLYHKEYVLADEVVFDELGCKILDLNRFKDTFPHYAFKTDVTPDYILCPCFLTGFYGAKLGYELDYGMVGFNYGSGKIILSSFDILNNLGYPTADKLLCNLISKFKA